MKITMSPVMHGFYSLSLANPEVKTFLHSDQYSAHCIDVSNNDILELSGDSKRIIIADLQTGSIKMQIKTFNVMSGDVNNMVLKNKILFWGKGYFIKLNY